MTLDGLWIPLLVALGISLVLSFFYMVERRGLISALFWTLMPWRLMVSWASDTDFDDNPPWLDRLQIGLILALALLWLLGRSRH